MPLSSFRNLALILLSCIVLSSCTKKIECSNFKTGTFKFAGKKNSDIRIFRTEDSHIEVSEKYNYRDEYSVKWLDECTYVVTLKKTDNDDTSLKIGDSLTWSIIETNGNNFIVEGEINGETRTSEMVKIE